ncbi:sortase (surface protein transpeptidase) [Streptomyces sp. SAI-135]|uniref:class F sortase n=1 Tax=unclassified Streptomyces TaxID=2593676 RepID=UPI00247689A0|nr:MULTISPECIES: class F sortase [unclassified Streptomyces]MDH6518820.1 sortase (surface protein transpeptidase) [Streptomyces sp. SAI-090]MDH6617086.1 sortase (surface protein transpeptidase) [Streptomyces sp. SAI-135]
MSDRRTDRRTDRRIDRLAYRLPGRARHSRTRRSRALPGRARSGRASQGRTPYGRAFATGRLPAAAVWAVLLLGLWLWGREATDVRHGLSAPATGDAAALGRLSGASELPPPARPLTGARPQRLDIPGLGVQAPVVARGLDARGAPAPPPFDQPGVVGWYAAGAKPGAAGTALMVGHVDTETRPAVFHRISSLDPGETVRVIRDDGRVAEFTVDDVRVLSREDFDARLAYGPHVPGRAELRLITCGGTFDRASRSYTANVIVSAYLTGTGL